MKTRLSRHQAAKVLRSRWLAYATATTATALAATNSAEADIHYSGRLDVRFHPDERNVKTFQLDQPGDSFMFFHYGTRGGGPDYFGIVGIAAAGFIGGVGFDYATVSRLRAGEKVLGGNFISFYPTGLMALYDFPGQWTDHGVGFIGFSFNSGAGRQYGWARVRMGGSENNNGFSLLDYAYADPGEQIRTGQKSGGEMVTDEGSLGWLALGAVGLLAWRLGRLAERKPASPTNRRV